MASWTPLQPTSSRSSKITQRCGWTPACFMSVTLRAMFSLPPTDLRVDPSGGHGSWCLARPSAPRIRRYSMGSLPPPVRYCLIVLACLALVAGTALPEIWAQAADSHPLVGKWEGTWVNLSRPNARGDYTLTVTVSSRARSRGELKSLSLQAGTRSTTLSAHSKVTNSLTVLHPPRQS